MNQLELDLNDEPLKPKSCPWCGEIPKVNTEWMRDDRTFLVELECTNDYCSIQPVEYAEFYEDEGNPEVDLIKRWNTRT